MYNAESRQTFCRLVTKSRTKHVENNWNSFITDNDDLTRICRAGEITYCDERSVYATGVVSRADCNEIIAFLCTS